MIIGAAPQGRTPPAGAAHSLLEVSGALKDFGAVRALDGVDFHVATGEVVGLVGHNGAGKSTLINVLSGTIERTAGEFFVDGVVVGHWTPNDAQKNGLRVIFQELSLCANLTAVENTRVIHRALTGFSWKARATRIISDALDEIFPGHGIPLNAQVNALSIGERQMIEIARAFSESDTKVRCVILDEPTSALGHEATKQLLAHVRRAAGKGIALIFITHRLNEILNVCDRVVVMKDGKVAAEHKSEGLTRSQLVESMGSIEKPRDGRSKVDTRADGEAVVRFAASNADDCTIEVRAGEIVGFAGLDGHGQRERLRAMFAACERSAKDAGSAPAFVAGDRVTEGVFALWSIADNLTIRDLGNLARRGIVSMAALRGLATDWFARMDIMAPSIDTPILSLSGGNQQKVLFARALASDARVIFLDDPMRGVDVGTKQEVYNLISQEAQKGRCFVWYTTELEELENCARIYVFREGRAVVKLEGEDISQGNILQASFGVAHG